MFLSGILSLEFLYFQLLQLHFLKYSSTAKWCVTLNGSMTRVSSSHDLPGWLDSRDLKDRYGMANNRCGWTVSSLVSPYTQFKLSHPNPQPWSKRLIGYPSIVPVWLVGKLKLHGWIYTSLLLSLIFPHLFSSRIFYPIWLVLLCVKVRFNKNLNPPREHFNREHNIHRRMRIHGGRI